MYALLLRNPLRADGTAVTGRLYVDGKYVSDTLELPPHQGATNCFDRYNQGACIAPGWYPVRLTRSPRFGVVLPLLDNVISRSGIRIHAGNSVADTQGCILVGTRTRTSSGEVRLRESKAALARLMALLMGAFEQHEPIWLEVRWKDPTEAVYDNITHRGKPIILPGVLVRRDPAEGDGCSESILFPA